MGTADLEFRKKLAEGFLQEAKQDFSSGRWRSCVDNSQLSVENAAKMAIAIFGSAAKNHRPAQAVRWLIQDGRFPQPFHSIAEQLAECADQLGPETHVQSDYGDETSGLTPWELFGEADAIDALRLAESAFTLAGHLAAWAENQL